MIMAIVLMGLVCVLFMAVALYYWAKAAYYKALLKDTWKPLAPPNLDGGSREYEEFWDYVKDQEDNGF
jgi:hypothetical protein